MLEEVLAALKGLQSVVSAGVTYRDYGPRVADTDVRVDRAFETPTVSPSAKLLLI